MRKSSQKPKDSTTKEVASIILRNLPRKPKNILVVGCGSGIEAAILAQEFGARVIGVDIAGDFSHDAAQAVVLEVGDAMALRFKDRTFDLVYSYHSLEHISDPRRALLEMKRVLRDDGSYWIGTPNRHRLIGYIGSKSASISQKIHWNLIDWRQRLRGRFRNEFGAHAGFSSHELKELLLDVFSTVRDFSDVYYSQIYRDQMSMIRFLQRSRLSRVVYPGVYFMGSK